MKNKRPLAVHPIQPLELDEHGVLRFKRNKIVEYLLTLTDMNELGVMDFSREDREQFAQLIGYSHDGASNLSYVSDSTWFSAVSMYEKGLSSQQARLQHAETLLRRLRKGMRKSIADLYGLHEDDLKPPKLDD